MTDRARPASRWGLVLGCMLMMLQATAQDIAPTRDLDGATTHTELTGVVVGETGGWMRGATVCLVKLDEAMPVGLEEAAGMKHFTTTTDADGRFTLRLLNRNNPANDLLDEQVRQTLRPGYGEYRLVVQPMEGYAGAISEPIRFEAGTENFEPVVLTIQPATRLEGIVRNPKGMPIPMQDLSLQFELTPELESPHETAIWRQKTRTDAAGHFVFEHLYPGTLTLGNGGPAYHWLGTRLGREGELHEDRLDRIALDALQPEPWIEIVATPDYNFTVSGMVANAEGRPIADAEIILALSSHAVPHTPRDHRGYPAARTGRDGRFEVRIGTPWITSIAVRHEGYEFQWFEREAGALPPGQYDFVLKPKAPDAQSDVEMN